MDTDHIRIREPWPLTRVKDPLEKKGELGR